MHSDTICHAVIDHVQIDNQQIRWLVDGPNRVDVIAFLDALGADEIEAAASAYGGDLLPECYDDWVLAERDRLRTQACAVLIRLAEAAEAVGDDHAVLRHASALLDIDPVAEIGHRAVIGANWRLGNRAGALRAYHRCAEVLDAELGVEPDADTRELYEQLRSVDEHRPEPSPRGRVATTLVGRDQELDVLRRAWEDSVASSARMAMVSGEPGIGKSRLAQAMAREAGPGALVVHARAYEAAGRLPWGPVVEWLRSPAISPRVARLDAGWRAELSTLLPELVDDSGSSAGPLSGDVSRRRQLFDAVAEALLSEPGPILLIIDDLQWCDADTIDFIGFLISSRAEAPVFVLGTARDEEVDDAHPLHAMTRGLARIDAFTELPLAPLGPDAVSDLYLQIAGDNSRADVEKLWSDTVGNPLFVVEAARAGLGQDPDRPMSTTMKATISTRLGRLSPAARALVDVAATIGREFTVEALVAGQDDAEAEVLDALDELWHRQIVREQQGAYDFHHDRIREVAYEGISPVRRRRLHSAVADATIATAGRSAGPHSADLASHLERAARYDEALSAYTDAARHALEVRSPDEIVKQCQQGIAVVSRLPPCRERDERELDLRLMMANHLGIRDGLGSGAAREGFERSLSLARRLGREPDPSTLRGLAMAGIVFCDYDTAIGFGRELAQRADAVSALRGRVSAGCVRLLAG